MRALFVFALGLALIALPAAAQEAGGKTKTAPPARTMVEGLRMSSGLDALNAFIKAYAASDYVSAYYLLSPDAKMDFLTTVNEYNYAVLFPDLENHAPSGSVFDINTDTAKDLTTDVTPDGALMFDDLMITAERQGVLPFDLSQAVVTSPTIDRPDQGRYLVGTSGDPSVVIISTIRLSNGDWRIERVVWAASDPDARPWGRK